jgi:hypothetical protein
MKIIVDSKAFQAGHQAFLNYMSEGSGGIEFTGFDHPFFLDDEISYKLDAARDGRKALQVEKWDGWRSETGKILDSLKAACAPNVSHNLMEHRYGDEGNSYSPLYRVKSSAEIAGLESVFWEFFRGGSTNREDLGPRFDKLVSYLRDNRLGTKWPFLAYLSFLLDSRQYFPILPGKFQGLLHFYGIKLKIARNVEWKQYLTILHLADHLKEQLSQFGTPTAIDVQSYMWVVSSLVKDGLSPTPPDVMSVGPEEELARRQRKAAERERIGLLGEWRVLEAERRKLVSAGLPNLAKKILHVAQTDESRGFDILSFDEDGSELHIEVKSTQRDKENDFGFWLTANEHRIAHADPSWCVYRVWRVDSSPYHENIGNIAKDQLGEWVLEVDSWFVARNQ